ncbi:hypothetical protein, partial [Pseudohaliea rubra]|uniref:hypothetical protein n=1 Tax=Pseudohaliea rubra TaxID=475795 RepID=UPI000551ED6E
MKRIALSLAGAAFVLYLVLVQPNHPAAMHWDALGAFPLEWPAVLLALLALGAGRAATACRVALVGLLVLIAVLKAADYAMFTALARGFNPAADLALVGAGLRLLTGTIGPLLTSFAAAGAVLAAAALAAVLWW